MSEEKFIDGETVTLRRSSPLPPLPTVTTPYEFLQVNGFIYRCNTKTGETWRLEANPADKKAQVWKKVSEIDGRA